MKIAILGAGLTGIETGRRLKELGKDFVILEKESRVGGLCRTHKTGDYYWDFAVHAIYSRSAEAMDFFRSLPLDYKASDRNVKVFHCSQNGKKYIIDYPFENGVRELPFRDKMDCIAGYIAARMKKKEFHNLKEWIDSRVGSGIARQFMDPYNTKIWDCELTKISDSLAGSKIEPAPAWEFIKNALGKKTVGRLYQSKFIYPKGGIQELCGHLSAGIKDNIFLNNGVTGLSRQGDKWLIETSAGQKVEADKIISTIPLAELLKMVDIKGLAREYSELRWNNTYFVLVGLKPGRRFGYVNDCHWAFFKGDEIFYRLTMMHNFSDRFLPSLVAEVTDKGAVLNMSPEEVKNKVVDDLLKLGVVISRDDIVTTDIKRAEYTYNIPTVGLAELKKKINAALKEAGIILIGRNGNWDYINMDVVYLKVKDSVPQLSALDI